MAPCWFTLDPSALLMTSHFQEGLPEIPAEWLAQEYYEDDYNKMADVARSRRGVATLDDATCGHPERSARYEREMVPWGAGQEVLVALRTAPNEAWGIMGLYRELGAPMFGAEDLSFMSAIAPILGAGARRTLLIGEARDPVSDDSPGMLVLTSDLKRDTATAQAERWLEELDPEAARAGRLPAALLAVGGSVLGGEEAPVVRVRSRAGRWILVHGSRLGAHQVALMIEPAPSERIAPLLMAAYGLTPREQEITALVLRGHSTAEIGRALVVSPHTVQEHLKHIFEKTGVRSRRDLAGQVFFRHYEPRLRENEQRTIEGKAVRGAPHPGAGLPVRY
jgi:DNA-binding CsgD family transcriptional regulator